MRRRPGANAKFLIPNSTFPLAWGGVLAALLLQQTLVRAARPDGIDLTSYLLSARALARGASPYLLATPFPYLYPPTLAFLLMPLAMVPAVAAVTSWFALNAVAAVWAVHRTVMAVPPRASARPDALWIFLALFFTFFFPIVQSNLRNGQVNLLVLALCIASALPAPRALTARLSCTGAGALQPPLASNGLRAAADPPEPWRRRAPPARTDADTEPRILMSSAPCGRRRSLAALPALLWSLAIAIKIVPLVLLPWFALRQTLAWMLTAAFLCGALLALPAVVLGPRIVDLYRQFADVLLAAGFSPHSAPLDFGLAGAIAALTGAPATAALKISAAAVVFGWILQVDARRLRRERARPLALYLLGIPLASPKSEVHHLAFMLPAAALAARECWWPARARRREFVMAAAAAGLLFAIAMSLPQANGLIYCAALVALAVAVMYLPEEK